MIHEKKYLMLILLLSAILLTAPQAIRTLNHSASIANSEAYYNIRIYDQESSTYDFLQGHSIPLNILNSLKVDRDISDALFRILPVILGIATILLTYLILHKQNIPEKSTLAIIMLITISPIFIYTFTDFKIQAFVVFLNMLGLYLLTHDKILVSGIPLAMIPFIDLFSGIVTLAFLLIYMLSSPRHKTGCKVASVALFTAVILSLILNLYRNYPLRLFLQFDIQNVLTEIGADIGISFSIIILAIIGIILLWEDGWKNFVIYSMIILLMIASLFNPTIRIYMNFVIMIYAGFAFIYLNRRKWSISIIKKTTLLLIICSIFFSTLVYMTKVVSADPTPEYLDALDFIKSQSLPTEVILSDPGHGYLIEYYTERMVLVDDSTKYFDRARYDILDNITSSRNLERTEEMLQRYNIKYVIIDDSFGPYLEEKEGLLFLIENSRKFTNTFMNEHVQVWMYTPTEI